MVTPHGMLTPWSLSQSRIKKGLYFPVERRNIGGAAALHFFTVEESEQSVKWGSHAEIVILPNGVSPFQYHRTAARERLERLYPELRRKVVLLFLGRLHPGKGLELLIPAYSRLRATCPECALVVCGPDAEYGFDVERMVKMFDLSKSVVRTGLLVGESKRAVLGGADIFVLPSRHECDSIAIKEAMQAGLPVVVTPECGLQHAVAVEAGIIVRPDVSSLVHAMERLVLDVNLRQKMGDRGRAIVEREFTWDKIVSHLLIAYEHLVTHRRIGGSRSTDHLPCAFGT